MANGTPPSTNYHVKLSSICPIPCVKACRVLVEIWFTTRNTPDHPDYDVTYDVLLPNNLEAQHHNGQWVRHLHATILEMLQNESPLDETNCDGAVDRVLRGLHLPTLQLLHPGTNKTVMSANRPLLCLATVFYKSKIFQIRVKLKFYNNIPVWELILKDTGGAVDLAVADGVVDKEMHNEMSILIWSCPSYHNNYSFVNDAMELFTVQKIVNPPSFALNEAPTICPHFPFSNHHLVSSWRGGIFILWRWEEVSIHFFEELIATASALVMDYPRNLFFGRVKDWAVDARTSFFLEGSGDHGLSMTFFVRSHGKQWLPSYSA